MPAYNYTHNIYNKYMYAYNTRLLTNQHTDEHRKKQIKRTHEIQEND